MSAYHKNHQAHVSRWRYVQTEIKKKINKKVRRQESKTGRRCYCGNVIDNSKTMRQIYCSIECQRAIDESRRRKHQSHVMKWRKKLHKSMKKHSAHVKEFDKVASVEMQSARYEARGEPWNNPRLSDAEKYKTRYQRDTAFRLSEINRNTWRKETLQARDDGTANFWALLRERKTCPYCGILITADNAVVDHMDPLKCGGANGAHNLTICCRACNAAKAATLFTVWVSKLPSGRRNAAIRWYVRKQGRHPEHAEKQRGFVFQWQ